MANGNGRLNQLAALDTDTVAGILAFSAFVFLVLVRRGFRGLT